MEKIQIKKILIIAGAVGIVALIGFNVYYFGWLKMREDAFQVGLQTAQIQINNAIFRQLNDTGQLRINIPVDEAGKIDLNSTTTVPIILIPKQ